jgi:hypothetical protein
MPISGVAWHSVSDVIKYRKRLTAIFLKVEVVDFVEMVCQTTNLSENVGN